MRVDEIRLQLRRRGVTGTSGMRKPELVKVLAKAVRGERQGGGLRSRTGPAAKSATAGRGGTKSATAGRGAAGRGAAKSGPATQSAEATSPAASTPVRMGNNSSRSVRNSQHITSVQDVPERAGRSLVTANHDVIRRWARARGAKPATIAGTEHRGRPGVLTFNVPGYRESSRIRQITWDEWFRTFDERRLNLVYQEQLRNGRQSNFFRTESPQREDA